MSSDESLDSHSPSGNSSDQESDISVDDISVDDVSSPDISQDDISLVEVSSDDDAPLRRPRQPTRAVSTSPPVAKATGPPARRRPAVPKARRDKSPRRPSAPKASAKTPGPRSMSKQWCYTINSPRKSVVQNLRSVRHSKKPAVEYHVFQLETGASGTLHVQGFIALAKRAQLSTV